MDALLTRHDTAEGLPGAVQLTDGLGLRPAHADLSRRIAERGFAKLMELLDDTPPFPT